MTSIRLYFSLASSIAQAFSMAATKNCYILVLAVHRTVMTEHRWFVGLSTDSQYQKKKKKTIQLFCSWKTISWYFRLNGYESFRSLCFEAGNSNVRQAHTPIIFKQEKLKCMSNFDGNEQSRIITGLHHHYKSHTQFKYNGRDKLHQVRRKFHVFLSFCIWCCRI